MPLRSRCRRIALQALAGLLSFGVVFAGIELATHDHLQAAAGWHDAAPHEHGPDGHALKSCSVCRMAHESGSTPAVLAAVGCPEPLAEPRVPALASRPYAVRVSAESPRAPPAQDAC